MTEYRTEDVLQASVLLCLDNPIQEIDSSTRRVEFVFEMTEKLNNDLRDIISRKVRVDPFEFKSNQDYLYNSVRSLTRGY